MNYVPYHLRSNKHIERRLFIDLLSQLDAWLRVQDCVYISMGGWLLEDHILMHDRFGVSRLISLEADEITHGRQMFNLPIGAIECRCCSVDDFIESFEDIEQKYTGNSRIIWLDYCSASERREQLCDIERLTAKLQHRDVLKVTMNAEPTSLAVKSGGPNSEVLEQRLARLKERLGQFYPSDLTPEDMNDEGLAKALYRSVKKAFLDGSAGSPSLTIEPLCACRYRDENHQMLTVTVVVLNNSEIGTFRGQTAFDSWEFRTDWNTVNFIRIPVLSLRERFRIDPFIGTKSITDIHNDLGFKFKRSAEESQMMLEEYVRHYRRYPTFLRISF